MPTLEQVLRVGFFFPDRIWHEKKAAHGEKGKTP